MQNKVQPQVITNFNELNSVMDVYSKELENNNESTDKVNNHINDLNKKLDSMRSSLMRQKMLMIKIMLKKLGKKKAEFKDEALGHLAELNDKIKIQKDQIKDLGCTTPVNQLGSLEKHEKVDIEQQLKN